jgi:hypothetical protein
MNTAMYSFMNVFMNYLHVPDIQDNPAEQPQLNALHEDPYEPVEKHLT